MSFHNFHKRENKGKFLKNVEKNQRKKTWHKKQEKGRTNLLLNFVVGRKCTQSMNFRKLKQSKEHKCFGLNKVKTKQGQTTKQDIERK